MLFIIATPIGNLRDISLRALDVLRQVDKIYCEDTRVSRKLLHHYQIFKPIDSLHQHSQFKIKKIIAELKGGKTIAYLTDAGTPSISDPGSYLVKVAQLNNISVTPIPGASAVTALLSTAGLPADSYYFAGYVPTKKGRRKFLQKILNFDETVVIFASAHRFHKLLYELEELGANWRTLVVGRELTKQFEEIVIGNPKELAKIQPKGEFVIAIAAKDN